MRSPCLLSVDLEEWSDARLAGVPLAARDALPLSLEESVDRLLALFERRGARATFFVLGRVARRYPALVRRIGAEHEIGSHGDSHEPLPVLGPKRLAEEIRGSRALLQDLTGQRVSGYRSPHWSMGACLDWGPNVLEDVGVLYDSSLVPGRGLPLVPGALETPRRPHRLGGLWEFPPTVLEGPGFSLPVACGAFLRALPLTVVSSCLSRASRRGEIPHLALHPWEFDPPSGTRLGAAKRALLFGGSRNLPLKVSRILSDYRGTTIEDCWRDLSRTEPAHVPVAAGARS